LAEKKGDQQWWGYTPSFWGLTDWAHWGTYREFYGVSRKTLGGPLFYYICGDLSGQNHGPFIKKVPGVKTFAPPQEGGVKI